MGGLTAAGQVLLQTQDHACRGPDVVRYLKHLRRHIPGPLLVIWDGSPIHRAQPVKAFLAQGGSRRIHLEQLPGYAPELNPAEGLWQQLKHGELRNVCCRDLVHLRVEFRRAVERLRHKHLVLRSCVTRCGYTLSAEAPCGSPSTTEQLGSEQPAWGRPSCGRRLTRRMGCHSRGGRALTALYSSA